MSKIMSKVRDGESPWKNNGGHNKKYEDPVRIQLYCEKTLREDLRTIANDNNVSVNDIVHQVVTDFNENYNKDK